MRFYQSASDSLFAIRVIPQERVTISLRLLSLTRGTPVDKLRGAGVYSQYSG